MIIGFSTGALYKNSYEKTREGIKTLQKLGSTAIEFNYNPKKAGSFLNKIKKNDLKGFEYISFHAPSGIYKGDKKTEEILNKIQEYHNKLNFNTVVFHPDEIKDKAIFDNYSIPVAIENMDWRKPFGKNIKDIEEMIEDTNFKFVLDLNHIYTIDKTLKITKDFYKKFKDKICEIHLSGFKTIHDPLYLTKQDFLINVIPDRKLPIIIESFRNACEEVKEAKKELEYITKRM